MIVGTAGHIDHGKTTLVRSLTGVDTDRLPEEKQRGISIELGYAFLDVPGELPSRIGFIDVPGHERLVHTMISGATGIDLALLLVAADDGPMPQTREHLAVLSLLGLGRAIVVVTKCDRVDPERRLAVVDECRALVHGTSLAEAPVVPVSATTGEGLQALREALFAAARSEPQRDARDAAFRMAVDRVFTLGGVGTVVTGTVHAGRVRPGDELQLVPGTLRARVRSLHAQNRPVESAGAGERCAIALAGVDKPDVARGQWLCDPAVAIATDRLDARLTLWAGEARSLRSGTPVHVHLGAAATTATVAVLDGDALAPGATALVQLVLRTPVGAWAGEPVVLRDASATRTLAGGQVLDPLAPARHRRTPQRLAELAALGGASPTVRLAALLESAPFGLDATRLAVAQGIAAWPERLPLALTIMQGGRTWLLGSSQAEAARQRALQALAGFHAAQPDELGPDAARLRRLALPRLPEPLWRAVLETLVRDGRLVMRGAFVHLPEHGVRLSAAEQRIAQKSAPLLAAAGFDGAWVRDIARDTAEPEPMVRVTMARLAQQGEVHQVVKDLYLPPAAMERLGRLARSAASAHGGEVTAAAFRDATQLGRKRAIQILEYLDRIGLLRRVGDAHRLRSDSTLFATEANAA